MDMAACLHFLYGNLKIAIFSFFKTRQETSCSFPFDKSQNKQKHAWIKHSVICKIRVDWNFSLNNCLKEHWVLEDVILQCSLQVSRNKLAAAQRKISLKKEASLQRKYWQQNFSRALVKYFIPCMKLLTLIKRHV